jgi:hypothetical protein
MDGNRDWMKLEEKGRDLVQKRPSEAESSSESEQRRRRSAAFAVEMARQWATAAETAETAHELENRYKSVFPGEAIARPIDLPVPNPDVLELR